LRRGPRPLTLARAAVMVGSALLLAALGFGLTAARHGVAPDVYADELVYSSAARAIATGHGLTVQGQPFFWQAPLFLTVEVPLIWAFHLAGQPAMQLALDLRPLNAAVAAATAVCLFGFVSQLGGLRAGWIAALLFLTTPYTATVARRLLVDPLAALLILVTLWACYRSLGRWSWRRRLATGLLLGSALLAKELTGYVFAVLVLLWVRREVRWTEPVAIGLTACCAYGAYPLWAAAGGLWPAFVRTKLGQAGRLVGAVHSTSLAIGQHLGHAVVANAGDDWPSYLCLALSVPATVWLWRRPDRASRFVSTWAAVSLVFFAALFKFGSLHDQFVTYLMLASLASIGLAAATAGWPRAPGLVSTLRSRQRRWAGLAIMAGVAVLGVAGLATWARLYGTGRDDGIVSLVRVIDRTVPRGAAIGLPVSELELLHFAYPHGRYRLIDATAPPVLRRDGIRWVVFSTKDVAGGEIGVPAYRALVRASRLVWRRTEPTFQTIELRLVRTAPPAPRPRSARPAAAP